MRLFPAALCAAVLCLPAATAAAKPHVPPPGKPDGPGAGRGIDHGKGNGKGKGKGKPTPTSPGALPAIGMADQKDAMFVDPRFKALGIRYARYSVAWDAMKTPWQVAELDSWLTLARQDGVEPLLTFAPSRLAGQRREWPSPAAFVEQFQALRARYPWVTTFSTWNEANFCGFGPCREPQRVARWWRALSTACPDCTILGADVLDFPNEAKWTRAFIRAAHAQPAVWGFHNYVTANRGQVGRTREFLDTVSGDVWFTETGGLVSKRNVSTLSLPTGVGHAARVTKFIFTAMAALSPRVKRVYLYQWNSSSAEDTWDSGFVGPDGSARPSLNVLQQLLGQA
jgi:hypothetical protein